MGRIVAALRPCYVLVFASRGREDWTRPLSKGYLVHILSHKVPLSIEPGIPAPIYHAVRLSHASFASPKRHLDRIGRLCRTHSRDQHTERQTTPRALCLWQ